MTELLNKAFQELSKLPPDRQDEMAAMVLDLLVGQTASFALTPEQEAGIRLAIEQADRGDFANRENIDALYAKYGA